MSLKPIAANDGGLSIFPPHKKDPRPSRGLLFTSGSRIKQRVAAEHPGLIGAHLQTAFLPEHIVAAICAKAFCLGHDTIAIRVVLPNQTLGGILEVNYYRLKVDSFGND
jgi:hypothetical protein